MLGLLTLLATFPLLTLVVVVHRVVKFARVTPSEEFERGLRVLGTAVLFPLVISGLTIALLLLLTKFA